MNEVLSPDLTLLRSSSYLNAFKPIKLQNVSDSLWLNWS